MKPQWAAPALRDLRAAHDFIARDKPEAAQRQLRLILAAIARHQEFPLSGKPGRRETTREMPIPRTPFLVIYRHTAGSVQVLRILHTRQRWP